MLYLRDDLKEAWKGQDPFELLRTMDGEVYRALEARRTFRFEVNGKGYFAKVHGGVGWYEIFENFIHIRKPVLGAKHEWEALNKLHQIGVKTMTPVGFGIKGSNPATQQSFLITEELKDMITLEDFCEQWKQQKPSFQLKKAMTLKLAEISRTIHENGLNHRDYYLCHFMMPKQDTVDPDHLTFYLIDLHRAQIRDQLPDRWRLKDLSGLYFSAMDYGITQRDVFRFLKAYSGKPLREVLSQYQEMLAKIEKKAIRLYQRMERKAAEYGY